MGKRIVNAYKNLDKDQVYSLKDAVKIVKENAKAKFDETIDIAINLGVDPKYADQMVRGVCALPNGSGKKVRVAVFAQGEIFLFRQTAGKTAVFFTVAVQYGAINTAGYFDLIICE